MPEFRHASKQEILAKMIIYSVTVKIAPIMEADWLRWMRGTHIPDVMATGLFEDCRMSRVLATDGTPGNSYNMQYLCQDKETLALYQEKHAPALQADHNRRYQGHYSAFRTLLAMEGLFKKQG
jgi:hypothetical protein